MAEISQIKLPDGSVNSLKDVVARKLVKGTLDATGTAAPDVSSLGEGQVWFYVITDGTLTGSKVKFSDTLSKAFFGKTGVGASVGDLLMVTKVKYLLVTTTVYKVIPLNDAKAADGDFPGCDGLETIWDKTQINKIPSLQNSVAGIENREGKIRDGSNMNDNLQTGFYPYCTLGRPAGSGDGCWYTLRTWRSKDADSSGYYTIEQIAVARGGNYLGRVFYRIIFVKDDRTGDNFGDWVEISQDAHVIWKGTGDNSTCQGTSTKASGANSHAEGFCTTASEYASHAEGNWTEASGSNSHAEGSNTIASKTNSHAEGYSTTASNYASHAEGRNTTASGYASHAEGGATITTNEEEHAQGIFNVSTKGVTIDSVGIGTADNVRKNAEETTMKGKKYILNVGNYDGTNVTDSSAKDVATVINSLETSVKDLEPSVKDLQYLVDYLYNHLGIEKPKEDDGYYYYYNEPSEKTV